MQRLYWQEQSVRHLTRIYNPAILIAMKNKKHETLIEVDINAIIVNPYQPRKQFSDIELQGLAESIQSVGLINPPVVRPHKEANKYELIAGERRLRAAKLAKLSTIPVVVWMHDETTSAHAALIENIQRVDLNAIEIAKALRALLDEFGLNQEELSLKIGKKRSTVANYLRLLTLSPDLQEAVEQDKISMGHAKALLSIEEEPFRKLLFKKIIKENLSVRVTEELAKNREKLAGKQNLTKKTDLHSDEVARLLEEKLGTRVTLTGKGQSGRVCIDYYTLDDLDRLLNLLGIGDFK